MTNWNKYHSQSEKFASEADQAKIKGDISLSKEFFVKAAQAEALALNYIQPEKQRTLGICYVSACSLWYKANNLNEAEQIAYKGLSLDKLPEFAIVQLKNLLQTIWSERATESSTLNLTEGRILVSVRGGQVVVGGAPLDLIVDKVQLIQKLFYRTVEFIWGVPHRDHGGPNIEILDTCRAWLFQAPAGSYQFAVAIAESKQKELFNTDKPTAKDITNKFFDILCASIDNPTENLNKIVEDKKYRSTFLKLIRNLAPSGETYNEMEINSKNLSKPIKLMPAVRKVISNSLQEQKEIKKIVEEETIKGVLRAVDLNNDWLEITTGLNNFKVRKVSETVDDLIGPLVNRPVIVRVEKDNKGYLFFVDIESAE